MYINRNYKLGTKHCVIKSKNINSLYNVLKKILGL